MKTVLAIILALATPLVADACSRCGRASCRSCNVVVRKFVPAVRVVERFVETPNIVQNFYSSVGASVRDYALAPPFVALAQQGQIMRQISQLQDRLSQYSQMTQQYASYAPPQFAPQQMYAPQEYQQSYQQPLRQQQYAPAPPPPAPRQVLSECPGPRTQANPYDYGQAVQQRVADQKCVQCHNNQRAEGDLNMQQPQSFEQRLQMLNKAMRGEMPKDGHPLTDEELRRFIDEEFSPEEQEALERAFGGRGQQGPPQPPQDEGERIPPPEQ